jgi:RNA polymerase sigma-70 factor (ECF subfamily)
VIEFQRPGHQKDMTLAVSRPSPEPGSSPDPVPVQASDESPERNLADLVERHLDFVWRLLRRFGLGPADAEDAAQQVLLIAAGKLAEIERGKTRTFLYGIALRVAANLRRGERRRLRASRENAELESARLLPSREVPWPDRLTELARARAFLDELLAQLPPELARVLVLVEIEQCTLPEIAELEALPLGTATSRLRRARASFQELLRREAHRNPLGQRTR